MRAPFLSEWRVRCTIPNAIGATWELYLLMAQSWLSLAHQDDATDELLANWGIADPIKADGIVLPFPTTGRG